MEKEKYMRQALKMAFEAAGAGEVPVGAVVVDETGVIIGRGRNRRQERSATAHAEIEAIDEACARRGSWHLENCTLYVTLEPCPMCAGAVINARVGTLVFGTREPKSGSVGSVIDLFAENYGFAPKVYAGVLEAECAGILREFFEKLREG